MKNSLRKSEALMLKKGQERLDRMVRNALQCTVFQNNQKEIKKREVSQYSTTHSGKKLKDLCLSRFVKTHLKDLKECHTKAFKYSTALFHLEKLKPELIAHITCNSIIDCMMSQTSEQKLVITIGRLVEDELRHRAFKSQNSRYTTYIKKKVREKDPNTYYRQRFNFRRKAEFVGLEYEPLPVNDTRRIGMYCYHTFLASNPNLIERTKLNVSRKKCVYKIFPTKETLEWLEASNTGFWQNHPMYLPFTVKPRDWKSIDEGVFTDDFFGKVKLVKDYHLTRQIMKEISQTDMPKVYTTLNAIQSTAWKINKNVFDVVKDFQHMGSSDPLIPSANPLPEPAKPEDIKTNKESRKAWSKLKAQMYKEELTRAGKRIQFKLMLELVEIFKDEPELYFGHNMDFRSRIYPLTTFLSNQGDSLAKGLLQFAESKPLGKDGSYWLAVHGANCFGEDKISLDDRVEWTKTNSKKILQVCDSPLDYLWWTEADSPWQFLAFCFEWKGFITFGENYQSSIPIQMDGSCNGLQHYSAMYLDQTNKVNLCPNVSPDDLYQSVTDKVIKVVNKDYLKGHAIAKEWEGKIDRKLVKRPVMTKCYSVTKQGISNQIIDHVKQERIKGKKYKFDNQFASAKYLTEIIWKAMAEAMPKADQGMKWFQDCADLCIEHDVDLKFVTPAGFPFYQSYRKPKMKRVESFVYNKLRVKVRHTMQFKDQPIPQNPIDCKKVRQSIAPNTIHALDASHLMLVVNDCLKKGIDSFSMVHDSYGVHACHVSELNKSIRDCFVSQYKDQDVVKEFYNAVRDVLPKEVEIPEPPLKGTLDLEGVKDSAYFFS